MPGNEEEKPNKSPSLLCFTRVMQSLALVFLFEEEGYMFLSLPPNAFETRKERHEGSSVCVKI